MVKLTDFVDETSVDVNEIFENTEYRVSYVLKKLYENSPKVVKLIGNSKIVKVKNDIIGKDKGYSSYVFRTVLHFDDPNKPTFSFVSKIPTLDFWGNMTELTDAENEHNLIQIRQMHNYECLSYELLKDLKEFPAPESYYLERAEQGRAGLIVMADLSQRGISVGLFYSVTRQQCFNLTRHIADFQIHGNFIAGRPWKEHFIKNMQTRPVVLQIWMKMIRQILDYDDKELQEKVKNILEIDFYQLSKYATEDIAKEFGCATLVHGDV